MICHTPKCQSTSFFPQINRSIVWLQYIQVHVHFPLKKWSLMLGAKFWWKRLGKCTKLVAIVSCELLPFIPSRLQAKWLHPMTNIETRVKSSPSSEMNLYPHDSYSYVLSITCPRPFTSKLHLLRVFQTNVRDGERKKEEPPNSVLCQKSWYIDCKNFTAWLGSCFRD